MLGRLFRSAVLARAWLSFVVLCAGFGVFGLCTLNLFSMVRLNVGLIADHGTMALADGALVQLVELLATLVIGMIGYIVFKACEHSLVHRLQHGPQSPDDEDSHS